MASGPVMQARVFWKRVLKLFHNPTQPFLPRRVQDVGAVLGARGAAAGLAAVPAARGGRGCV